MQSLPQSIPAGVERTRPVPPPVLITASRGNVESKRARTSVSADNVKPQVGTLGGAHGPRIQAPNTDADSALALSVIAVPVGNVAVQSGGQLIPDGIDTT